MSWWQGLPHSGTTYHSLSLPSYLSISVPVSLNTPPWSTPPSTDLSQNPCSGTLYLELHHWNPKGTLFSGFVILFFPTPHFQPPTVLLGSADAPVWGCSDYLPRASSLAPILLNRENSQKIESVLPGLMKCLVSNPILRPCLSVTLSRTIPYFCLSFPHAENGDSFFFPTLHDGYGGPDKISRDPKTGDITNELLNYLTLRYISCLEHSSPHRTLVQGDQIWPQN